MAGIQRDALVHHLPADGRLRVLGKQVLQGHRTCDSPSRLPPPRHPGTWPGPGLRASLWLAWLCPSVTRSENAHSGPTRQVPTKPCKPWTRTGQAPFWGVLPYK